jgi:hypothetical protein
MEKTIYFIDYDLESKQALFIGVNKNSEHSIELELNDAEFSQLADNLDFIFIKDGKPTIDENYKANFLAEVVSRNRIDELKALLSSSDWKVVVNAELFQAGLPLKYPNLHAERQAWRDEINQLEAFNESSEQ